MGGNNDVITELFLPRESLVSDIPAGDGKLVNLFLRCTSKSHLSSPAAVLFWRPEVLRVYWRPRHGRLWRPLRNAAVLASALCERPRWLHASPQRLRRPAGCSHWLQAVRLLRCHWLNHLKKRFNNHWYRLNMRCYIRKVVFDTVAKILLKALRKKQDC